MNHDNLIPSTNALDSLQSRFALRVAARLTERSDALGADVGERLRFAREQALQRAGAARTAQARLGVGVTSSGAVVLGRWGWGMRMAAVAPAIALVAGLVVIQKWQDKTQISVAAEIDTALLADDLPPRAYADVGFVEFLKAPRE